MTKLLSIPDFAQIFDGILKILPDCRGDASVELFMKYFAGHSGKEEAVNLEDVLQNFEQEREAGKFETDDE